MVTTFLIFRKGGHYFFMPSRELKETYEELNSLIEVYGMNLDSINTMYQLADHSIVKEKDVEFGLMLLDRARTSLEALIEKNTGSDVFKVDEYCKANKLELDEMKLWWKILLLQAQNRVLDAYLLYLEKNRDLKDKFYQPRRKCFLKIGLIQGFQDILDDKLDILSVSLIPGGG